MFKSNDILRKQTALKVGFIDLELGQAMEQAHVMDLDWVEQIGKSGDHLAVGRSVWRARRIISYFLLRIQTSPPPFIDERDLKPKQPPNPNPNP
jgi:hypothetical protein